MTISSDTSLRVPATSSSAPDEEVTRHREKNTHARRCQRWNRADDGGDAERTCGPVRARGTTDANFGGARSFGHFCPRPVGGGGRQAGRPLGCARSPSSQGISRSGFSFRVYFLDLPPFPGRNVIFDFFPRILSGGLPHRDFRFFQKYHTNAGECASAKRGWRNVLRKKCIFIRVALQYCYIIQRRRLKLYRKNGLNYIFLKRVGCIVYNAAS